MTNSGKRLNSHCYASKAVLFLVFLMVLGLQTSRAQIPVWPPNDPDPDVPWGTIDHRASDPPACEPDWINCDMYNIRSDAGSNGYLWAIVYDDPCSTNTVYIVVYDSYNSSFAYATIPDARHADVVIGDVDPTNLNYVLGVDFHLGVVYEDLSASPVSVNLALYDITDVHNVAVTLTSNADDPLSSTTPAVTCSNPHIDMAPDVANLIGGKPILGKYVATWTENDNGNKSVWTTYDDLYSGGNSTNSFFIDLGEMSDVAFAYDDMVSEFYAYLVYVDATGNEIKAADIVDFTGTPSINHITLESGVTVTAPPRIDAPNYSEPGPSRWHAIAEIQGASLSEIHDYDYSGGGSSYNPRNFDTVTTYDPWGVVTTSPCALYNGYSPAVACGNGITCPHCDPANVGNHYYSIGWYIETDPTKTPPLADVTSLAVDIGGNSHILEGYKQVNSFDVSPILPGKNLFAVASGTNDGYGLLTAWYGQDIFGSHRIFYKYYGNNFVHKPTNINESSLNHNWQVYPNPTTNEINIKGKENTAYTLTDISGRILMTGTTTKTEEAINIIQLPQGMYLLQLKAEGATETMKIVKQ